MHTQDPLIGDINSDKIVILLHGRGGNADDMLEFAQDYLAPARFVSLQADKNQWYPVTFMAPRQHNEPYLTAALKAVQRAVKQAGVPTNKIYIVGFSQGACLALEFAARNPGHYGGIIAFSGGLIGEKIERPTGAYAGTPIFIGCSQNDPHIPLKRAEESAEAFKKCNAKVTLYTYPGNTHTIEENELKLANEIIERN